MTTTMNRETWLNEMAALMAPRFEELGFPLPKFRVAVGWTSAGKSTAVGGECWHSSASKDRVFEILVAPITDDSMKVSAILAHELNHAASGFQHKHGGAFAKNMKLLGMVRPFTSSVPGDDFKTWVQPFIDQLGAIPHARILLNPLDRLREPDGDDAGRDDDGDGEGGDDKPDFGSSNAKKKQSTRMLKAACDAQGDDGAACGYTVRLTKKWASELGAHCPLHGQMAVEGVDA